MKRAIVIGGGLCLIVVLTAAALYGWGRQQFTAPGPLPAPKVVEVAKGAGLEAIAATLAREGVIEKDFIFEAGVRLLGRAARLRAGEFEFPAGISPEGAMTMLISGKNVQHGVTIAEGLSVAQILAQLNSESALSGTATLAPGEGELLPDTYNFSRGATPDDVVRRMRAAMREILDELWDKRAPNLPYKTKTEALILASIIEKETSLESERRRVAAVFVNRLRRGMRLQSDPTVIYGITGGSGPLGRQLLSKDLARPGPYNTYLIDRLPPGPIANPGRASIAAAFDPSPSSELYFVADGNGGDVFAETVEQHNKKVAQWRKIRRKRRKK